MPRPALGAAARTVVANTKISRHEKELLLSRHRSVHEALRHAIDMYMGSLGVQTDGSRSAGPAVVAAGTRAHEKVRETIPAARHGLRQPETVGHHQPVATGECRIHRAYEVTAEWFEHGEPWWERTCADCGHVVRAPRR